jgi:hypothetical protein
MPRRAAPGAGQFDFDDDICGGWLDLAAGLAEEGRAGPAKATGQEQDRAFMNRYMWMGGAIVAVVAVWAGAWFFAAGLIRNQIEGANDPENIQVECGRLAIEGFPFRFDVSCTDAVIVSGDISIASPKIKATTLVYRPTHILTFIDGPVTVDDAFSGSKERFSFTSLQLSTRFSGLMPDTLAVVRLSMVAENVAWKKPLLGDRQVGRLDRLEAHLVATDANSETGLTAFLRGAGIQAEPNLIKDGSLDVQLDFANAPKRLFELASTDVLALWQQNDGRLDIIMAELAATGLSAGATGNVFLDRGGNLNGRIKVKSEGIAEMIDLTALGPLGALILGQPDGTGAFVNVLDLRAGTVLSGLVPLAAIPSLF